MSSGTITYKSKEAGQTTTAATYLNANTDADLTAIQAAAAPFLVDNAIHRVNVRDRVIDGDGSPQTGFKEAQVRVRCADGTISSMHFPHLDIATTQQQVTDLVLGHGSLGFNGALQSASGSDAMAVVECNFINIHE